MMQRLSYDYDEQVSPDVQYEYGNDQLEYLLSCVGLKSLIEEFHKHGVYTLEDFFSRSREEVVSYGFIHNCDYDNLVQMFKFAVSMLNQDKDVPVEKYVESILESQYTQRLRESISNQGKYDVSEQVVINRDSIDDLVNHQTSSTHESSFEAALQWQVKQPAGYRHTVNVGSTFRKPERPFTRFEVDPSSDIHVERMGTELNTVNEIAFCEGMNVLNIDRFGYDSISEGSVEVYLAAIDLPKHWERSESTLSVCTSKGFTSAFDSFTSYQVDHVVEDHSVPGLVSSLASKFQPNVQRLFAGQSFTCCLYGSLMSPAAAVFYDSQMDDDTYEDSFMMENFESNSSILQQLGEMIFAPATSKKWKIGISAFLIQDNSVFDLLNNKSKLTVIDGGHHLVMRNITCYEIQNRIDLHSVICTIKSCEAMQPVSGHITVVYHLLNPQEVCIARMAVVLLAPGDKVVPVCEKQARGSSIRYKANDNTASMMTLSRVLTPGIRQPFRDSKLTLYLRPFIYKTTFVLVGCLPPYDDSIVSIPEMYVKVHPSKTMLVNQVKQRSTVKPVNNSENLLSIVRYCNSVYKAVNRSGVQSLSKTPKPVPRKTYMVRNVKEIERKGPNVFMSTTIEMDAEIAAVRKKVNEYMTTYSKDISLSRSNKTVSSMLRKASDLSTLLSRLSKL